MRNQWEYKRTSAYDLKEDTLNKLGREGWELITVYNEKSTGTPWAIFKREVPREFV